MGGTSLNASVYQFLHKNCMGRRKQSKAFSFYFIEENIARFKGTKGGKDFQELSR